MQTNTILDSKVYLQAIVLSFRKLDPRTQLRNPVMFVVEVGSVITTVLLLKGALRHQQGFSFNLQITLWLWFTVLFANFAEAMAEGRGKAQAESLRRNRARWMFSPTPARTRCSDGSIAVVVRPIMENIIYYVPPICQ